MRPVPLPPIRPADEASERRRIQQAMADPASCFVFGSNMSGRHGAGAALDARQRYGARYGQAEGRQGRSYAIPTKDAQVRHALPLVDVARAVAAFLAYAAAHPDTPFAVTRVGCGRAGFTDDAIAPLFAGAGPNVLLPPPWRAALATLA